MLKLKIITICLTLLLPSINSCKALVLPVFDIIGDLSSSGGQVTSVSNLDIDVLSSPKLPDFVEVPPIGDKLTKRIGIAYTGSNPSFEARLKNSKTLGDVKSVDLLDSQGMAFNDIPFNIINIAGDQNKIILTLTLPEDIATGEATFILNQADMTTLSGQIQVIDFFKTKIQNKKILIGPPEISRLKVSRGNDNFIFHITGKSFVGRKIVYVEDNTTKFLETPPDNPNTYVTIFPASLGATVNKRVVSENGKSMKIKITLGKKLQTKTTAVLVISTPRGIVSKKFILNP